MKKFSMSLTCIALCVVLSTMCILCLTLSETAEAGPTKYIVEYYWYKCSEIGTGVVCTPWFLRIKVTPKESWWHRTFGKHPHGFKYIYKQKDDVHEKVISCSECEF